MIRAPGGEAPAHIKAASPILYIVSAVTGLISLACILIGLYALGIEGKKTVIEAFEISISTQNVGVALVALGITILAFVFFYLLKTVRKLAEIPEEKIVSVWLEEIGKNKVSVIKALRHIKGFGLKEAKDIVESAPCIIAEDNTKKEAKLIKKILEGYGAKVNLR